MTELFVTKAIVKLPKKSASVRFSNSHHSMIDSSTEYATIKALQEENSVLSDYSDYLVTDKLYIDGLPCSVLESEIMNLVKSCHPERIHLNRAQEVAFGYIQFKNKAMADYAYTLLNGVTFQAGVRIQFKISPPSGEYPEPEAHTDILQIKNLPSTTDNKLLYELFRPFGPMILCKILVEQGSTFKGTALVQYFYSENAQEAETAMNNKLIRDNAISVFPFIPSNKQRSSVHSVETNDTPLDKSCAPTRSSLPPTPAPTATPSSQNTTVRSDGSNLIDYTNLYIKNLDLNVKSADLFDNFRRFGHIISARVMKNAQTKQSKGFGFVSFTKADEAQKAKQEMNGQYILYKPIIVAFHEPKKSRETTSSVSPTHSLNDASRPYVATSVSPYLAQQQQFNKTSPPTSSFASPTHPYAPEFHQQYHHQQGNSVKHQSHSEGYMVNNVKSGVNRGRTRDASDQRLGGIAFVPQKYGSYQQTSPNGVRPTYQPMEKCNSNSSYHQPNVLGLYDQRQYHNQTPPKRHYDAYQYNGSVKRNLSATGSSQQPPSLSTLASGTYMSTPQITTTTASTSIPYHSPHPQQYSHMMSPASQYSINNNSNNWQQQQQQPYERPSFRRRGSVESMASIMTETTSQTRRHTIMKAVMTAEKNTEENLNDIIDMLLTLKKKDLATCLFNRVFLKAKIKQAKDALNIFVEEEQPEAKIPQYGTIAIASPSTIAVMPNYTYQACKEDAPSCIQYAPLPPKTSRAIPIVAPPPTTSATSSKNRKISEGAATASVATAASTKSKTVSADKDLQKEIDDILKGLEGLTTNEKKQRLGNILYPLVKSTGIKQASTTTIRLLDNVPLDEIVRFMYDKDKLKQQMTRVTSTVVPARC